MGVVEAGGGATTTGVVVVTTTTGVETADVEPALLLVVGDAGATTGVLVVAGSATTGVEVVAGGGAAVSLALLETSSVTGLATLVCVVVTTVTFCLLTSSLCAISTTLLASLGLSRCIASMAILAFSYTPLPKAGWSSERSSRIELPSLCRVSTRGWTLSVAVSALVRTAGRMRAEESVDEKTRQKTRLRRDGIFGTGFVASGKSSAVPVMLTASSL